MSTTSLSPTEFSPPRLWVRTAAVVVGAAALVGVWQGLTRQLEAADRAASFGEPSSGVAVAQPMERSQEPRIEEAPPPAVAPEETAPAQEEVAEGVDAPASGPASPPETAASAPAADAAGAGPTARAADQPETPAAEAEEAPPADDQEAGD